MFWVFLARIFVVGAILTLNPAASSARDDVRTYRCLAKEGVHIRGDGTLDHVIGEVAQKHFDKVVNRTTDRPCNVSKHRPKTKVGRRTDKLERK
jgi:hypothetical protein